MSCMVTWVLKFWMPVFIILREYIFIYNGVKCFHVQKIMPGFQFSVQKLKSCISQEFSNSSANFYLNAFFFTSDVCLLKARTGFFYYICRLHITQGMLVKLMNINTETFKTEITQQRLALHHKCHVTLVICDLKKLQAMLVSMTTMNINSAN